MILHLSFIRPFRNLAEERVDNALLDAKDIIGKGVWASWEIADCKIVVARICKKPAA